MIETSKIAYFAEKEQFPFFFTEKLQAVTQELSTALKSTDVWMFPDATLKTNGLPTGIACISPRESTLLLPYVLRDPGCGFLTFKLEFTEKLKENWHHHMGQLIDNFINHKRDESRAHSGLTQKDILAIITKGLSSLPIDEKTKDKFINSSFPVDANLLGITQDEIEKIYNDLFYVTNTIEIRSFLKNFNRSLLEKCAINDDHYIGFIHSGSFILPHILADRFLYAICKHADINNLFSIDEIDKGIVGVPLNSLLGMEYNNWLNAAMNYALVNRYLIFEALKSLLEAEFPCRLSIINDNMHAGNFKKQINYQEYVFSMRGVQNIMKTSPVVEHTISLLAGQRETIAALVTGGDQATMYNNIFSHGTGYEVLNDYDYAKTFSQEEIQQYLKLAQAAYYNSVPRYEECIPHTHNLINSINYFEKIGLANTVALLSPLINVQSDWLKS